MNLKNLWQLSMKKITIFNLIFLLNINLLSLNYTDNSYRDNVDYITFWTSWTQVAINIASVCLISLNFVATQCFWNKGNLRTSRCLARHIRELKQDNENLIKEVEDAQEFLEKLENLCKQDEDSKEDD